MSKGSKYRPVNKSVYDKNFEEINWSTKSQEMRIGDRVSVPCRFGETGVIKKIKEGRFGIEFKNLPVILWYNKNEIYPEKGEGFSWYRPNK